MTLRLIAIIISIPIFFNTVGCEENGKDVTNNNSVQTQTTIKEENNVKLKTGANSEVSWQITRVQRTDSYYTPSMQLVAGVSVKIDGEAEALCRSCGFFEKEPYIFDLVTKSGQKYSLQAPIVQTFDEGEGTRIEFTVSFSCDVPECQNIKNMNWSELFVEDSNPAYLAIPGHKVDLSVFNEMQNV
jgi:hypothetical protein